MCSAVQRVRSLKRSLDFAPNRPSASKHLGWRHCYYHCQLHQTTITSPSTSYAQAVVQAGRYRSQRPSASALKILVRIARPQGSNVGYGHQLPRPTRRYAGGYRKSLAQRPLRWDFSILRPLCPSSILLTVPARHQRASKCRNQVDSGVPQLLKLHTQDLAHQTSVSLIDLPEQHHLRSLGKRDRERDPKSY